MILSTIDFLKTFDSVWHPALFHKLILTRLPPCFARWTQSFLSDRCTCMVFQNHKSRSFRVRQGVPQGSILGLVLFSLFINDLSASLPSSVSCSPYSHDLAIWYSSPRPPLRWRPHKELCFDWSAGLSTGVFLSIRANLKPPSSQWIPTKLTSSPTSSYSAPASISIQLLSFLGSPSTILYPFPNMYFCWRPSSSHITRPYTASLLLHGAPSKESLSLLYTVKLFFSPFSLMHHPDGFLS